MKTAVLILTGLPGSGKTTASSFFRKNNIPVFRMGDLTDEYLKKSDMQSTSENEGKARNDLRKYYGEEIYAVKTLQKIEKFEGNKKIIVIEGLKSKAELDCFSSNFPDLKIIYIKSGKVLRYKRLSKRKLRPLTLSQARLRDHEEIGHFGIEDVFKKADFVIENNGTLEVFYRQLEGVLNIVTSVILVSQVRLGASRIK